MDKIDDVGKKSTINDGRRNRRSIEDMCSKIESEKSLAVRCTNKKPVCDIVDEALWMWFVQERRRGTPISGPILIESNDSENEEIAILDDLQSLLGGECGNQMQFEDVEVWMTKSDEGLENEFFTDEEIIGIASKADCGCEDDGEDADMEDSQKIGHEEAKKAAEILLQYVEQQKDSTALDVMNTRKWRDLAFKMSVTGTKQKQITDFFKQ
ncbi:hypothetical protein QE152_g31214 [Popillia japonica]|uniref:Uncharacterized protein n=1 Tax=Popillia japonica TaxID=7064 RepID=A0AAW1JBU0_POPJA